MGEKRIVRVPHKGFTPEQARDARARAWAFVFSCWRAKREGGTTTTPDPKVREKEVSYGTFFG